MAYAAGVATAGAGIASSLPTRSEHFAPFDTQYVMRSRFKSNVAGLVLGLYVPTTSTGTPIACPFLLNHHYAIIRLFARTKARQTDH